MGPRPLRVKLRVTPLHWSWVRSLLLFCRSVVAGKKVTDIVCRLAQRRCCLTTHHGIPSDSHSWQ